MANRVSNDQLEELLDFLAEHPALAKGVGLGARSKETVDKQWESLATKLNSYGSGSSKSGERWKKYWADIKHKTKSRLAKRRRDASGTGGGPSSQEDLSEIDKKVLAVIGEQAVFGDSEHRIPFMSKLDFPGQGISQEVLITGDEAENVPVTVVSPSTRGQTCRLYTSEIPEIGSPSAKKVSETNLPEPLENIPVTGLESPVARPYIDRPQKRKRPHISNTTAQSRIDPEWIKELESRRVDAEAKLAEAALIMAESSRTQAEVAKVQADVMQTLVNLIRVQHQDVRALMELTREKAEISTQN